MRLAEFLNPGILANDSKNDSLSLGDNKALKYFNVTPWLDYLLMKLFQCNQNVGDFFPETIDARFLSSRLFFEFFLPLQNWPSK